MASTPSQTVGPFFHLNLLHAGDDDLVRPGQAPGGTIIEVGGRVLQGDGAPVNRALIEVWHADAEGRFPDAGGGADPAFKGFGRSLTDKEGRYRFRTVKPGPVPGPGNALQAPHIAVSIFSAGLLRRLVTRIYFADEPLNEADPVLGTIEDAEARHTLMAQPAGAAGRYAFDIVLRGDRQTAFFTD